MILSLHQETTIEQMEQLKQRLTFMGLDAALNVNDKKIIITGGVDALTKVEQFSTLPFVQEVLACEHQFKLTAKSHASHKSVINVKGIAIGGGDFVVSAGPCSIESATQIMQIAAEVSQRGARILRGGAFKPRTSPYDFQGLGKEGLIYFREAADAHDLLCVSEVMAVEDVPLVAEYVDILQIGARNMQNFALLKAVGQLSQPVLLKRGSSATYKEFLLAAEYILSCGNPHVILCERGIRTFESYSRNTLDIAAVPILQQLTQFTDIH